MTTATVVPIRREFQVHRFDPIKHGVLSRHIALPWEDREAFEEILRGLLVEHAPQGPTAYHLVEDLPASSGASAGCCRPKGAAIRERLFEIATGYNHEKVARYALAHKDENIRANVRDIVADRLPEPEDAARDIAMIERALTAAWSGKRGAYQAALRLLDEDTLQVCEAEAIEEEEPDTGGCERNADGLKEFLEETRSGLEHCIEDARNAPDVTDQVHGMAIDIRDLERIARIEAHLDAKMQRLLGLLQQCRKTSRSPRTPG